jgi:periplasmic protein TonB
VDEQKRTRRLLARAGVAVAVVAAVGVFGWFVHYMVSSKITKPPRQTQVVTLIRPPPPPMDQPPPPPPPERPKEEIAQNEPEPTPSEDPAPSTQLGLDTEGTAGGDSFGLAAHKGGHDLVGTGGAIFGWYTARLKDRVSERLAADARLRSKKFNVSLRVYIENDGRIREVHVVSTSGNGELDAAIEAAVAAIGKLNEAPPLEMPEPITIRIVSRTG